MNEDELKDALCMARTREKRLQWTITTVLCVTFFIAGMLFQAERLKEQVTTNTVEIRALKGSLAKIDTKLDRALERNRHD